MLTIEDIRNPRRESGFNYVKHGWRGSQTHPFFGTHNNGGNQDPAKPTFIGPRRATPEEAAQDYCNYVNGNGVVTAPVLKSADHPSYDAVGATPELQDARALVRELEAELERERSGYVYLVVEEASALLGPPMAKIGWSVNPRARCGSLQAGNPRKLCVLASIQGTQEDEKALHAKYIDQNILGEWFQTSQAMFTEFNL